MTEAMLTPWGEALDREHPLPEYPRPQLRRNSYLNLNGIWEYAITKTAEKPAAMQGEIVVPFSPETPLSGVGHILQPDEYAVVPPQRHPAGGLLPGRPAAPAFRGGGPVLHRVGQRPGSGQSRAGATCPLPWM